MGTPEFAATILQGLVEDVDVHVQAVVTQPDRPVGRKRVLTPPPVKLLAQSYQIPVYQPERLQGSTEHAALLKLGADLIITAAYGQILPKDILDSAKEGAINVHASLLPKYRGGAPIQYAIWQQEEETGVSIMAMTEELDAGAIYAQTSLAIQEHDDAGSLFQKLALIGKELLLSTLPKIFEGAIQPVEQEEDQVTYAPVLKKSDEILQWEKTAIEIDHHIRAFRPNPTTYTFLSGQRVKIWDGHPVQKMDVMNRLTAKEYSPGTIVASDDQAFYVQCGNQTYYAVESYQPAGKKKMPVSEFLKGQNLKEFIGQQFTSEIGE